MAMGSLNIVRGSTNYSFDLMGPVSIVKKPDTGEIQKTVAVQRRLDQIDAPLHINHFSGLGVSRAVEAMQDADNRFWEGENIQHWPGMWCLGPLARTTTDKTGTHRVRGFFQYRNNFFYFDDLPSSGTGETIATWATTGTWTDATATSDFNATAGANSGFPCVGMCERSGNGASNSLGFAIRQAAVQNGAAFYQLINTNSTPTTWTVPDHTAAANTPSGALSVNCCGIININGTLYTAVRNGQQLILRQSTSADAGVTWTTTATATEGVQNDPVAIIAHYDYAGTIRPWVFCSEGLFVYDGTSFYKAVDHVNRFGENQTARPGAICIWQPSGGPEGGYLAYAIGRQIRLVYWGDNNTPKVDIISPTYNTQGLPTIRDGQVTALAATPNFIFAAIGGDSSATTAGIYVRRAEYTHPLGWYGPIYETGTANRQIRAMGITSYDDNVVRLHIGVDNGGADDTDPLYFDNITSDPRTVSSYLHAASGVFIMPKNDRFLPEIQKVYRSIQVTGTGLSSSNKVTDIFVSADAAPLASDGSWGTTLGEITANAGTQNFSATPSGTGQSARSMQIRIDLEGASNASPYIEGLNVNMKTLWPVKYIRRFELWTKEAGSVRPLQVVLDEVEEIVSTTTDLNVTYGEETTAIVMEPWRYGEGPISYEYETEKGGTVNDHIKAINKVFLTLVDV